MEEHTEEEDHASQSGKSASDLPIIGQGSGFDETSSFESDSSISKSSKRESNQDQEDKPLVLSSSMAVKFAQAIRNKLLYEM